MWILFLAISIYSLLIVLSILGFFLLSFKKQFKSSVTEYSNFITVLIPFRNESERIFELLNSLSNQVDTKIIKEIFFINDHSADNSCEIISSWIDSSEIKSKIIHLESSFGKKNAINKGVENANTNYVLTLDADIYFNNFFFSKLANEINFDKGLYIFAVVENCGIFLSQIESHVLSILTLGMLNINVPILANGACLLFNREYFLSIDPFKYNIKISSGDDLFILKAFKSKKTSIQAISPFSLFVNTKGPENLKSLFSRSLRWAGKMTNIDLPYTKFFGMIILVINLISIGIFVQLIFDFSYLSFIFLTIKFTIDLVVSLYSLIHFKNIKLLIYFFPMFLLYPIFILINFLLLLSNYSTYWKGREVSN